MLTRAGLAQASLEQHLTAIKPAPGRTVRKLQ